MAKKEKKDEPESTDELSSAALSRLLIKELNQNEKGNELSDKIAWCLASDDDNPTVVREFISTGSTLLDYIISNRKDGGIPVGKLTEISGEEQSGKSLLCAHLIAECQRRGGLAVYIDVENSANPEFMERLGVDIRELVYLQPQTVEDVGEAIAKTILMARAKSPNRLILIVWDSVAGTPTKAEIEGDFDLGMDLQLSKSKVLSKMMRKLTEIWGKERICMVFTNQLKTKISLGFALGDPLTTPGGKAVPYHSSVRIRLTAGEKHKDGETKDVVGVHTKAKVVKNRLGPPWRVCEFDILFSSGIDDEPSWLDKLHSHDEIERADGWCYLTNLPSGKLEEKGSKKGTDRGVKFREGDFAELVRTDKRVKDFCVGLLEKHMIVRYGEKPKDMNLDPESAMDIESVAEVVSSGA